MNHKEHEAFIVGVSLGDGNLSNPNGRATRLRITLDSKYPDIIDTVTTSLQLLFPQNKVSLVHRKDHCIDVSVYSNKLDTLLPWKVGNGTKYDQQAHVPAWILKNKLFSRACLQGLVVTDGSIYIDRGYLMVNYCTNINLLARDVAKLGEILGFSAQISATQQPSGKPKYTVRFAKDTQRLLEALQLGTKS